MTFFLPVLITALMSQALAGSVGPTWAVQQDKWDVTTTGDVRQFDDLEAFRRAVDLPQTVVLYDIEHWRFTPLWQQNHPVLAMGNFVRLAHKRGLRAMIAPSGAIRKQQPGWAGVPADYLLVQGQGMQCDPVLFAATIAGVKAGATGLVIAEVSVMRSRKCDTIGAIRAAIASVQGIADGVSVWGLNDPAQVMKVEAVLGDVGPPTGNAP
jgi:hypothetical protein